MKKSGLFLLLVLLGFKTKAQTIEYGAYLQQLTHKSVIVCWKTDVETDSKLIFWSGQEAEKSVSNAIKTRYHRVKVDNLASEKKYQYKIGNGQKVLQATEFNYFVTNDLTEKSERIWVIGDFGDAGARYMQIQKNVLERYYAWHKTKQTDAWLWLGDNAYCCGQEVQYKANVFDIYGTKFFGNTPFYAATGNHEYYARTSDKQTRDIEMKKFVVNPQKAEMGGVASNDELYYSFDQGNAHFICLDSYGEENGLRVYQPQSLQYQWLERDLIQNKKPWTVVFFHHPPYTKRSHDSDAEEELRLMRAGLVPILEKYGVDLVLSGHSHIYERSGFINGHFGHSAEFFPPAHTIQVGKGDGSSKDNCAYVKTNQRGTIYSVVGSSGRLDVNPNLPPQPHPTSVYTNLLQGGSLVLDVTANELSGQWLAEDGVVYDKFSMYKNLQHKKELKLDYGSEIQLNTSWGKAANWSNGTQNTAFLSVKPLKDETFTATDANGCFKDEFKVKVTPQPEIKIQKIDFGGEVCNEKTGKIDFEVLNTDFKKWEYRLFISDKNGDFSKSIVSQRVTASSVNIQMQAKVEVADNYLLKIESNAPFAFKTTPSKIRISEKITATAKQLNTELRGTQKPTIETGTPPYKYLLSNGETGQTSNVKQEHIIEKRTPDEQYTLNRVGNVCGELAMNVVFNFLNILSNEIPSEPIVVFPNPAGSSVKIKNLPQNESYKISVFDVLGNDLNLKQIVENEAIMIETSSLKSGEYLLVIQSSKSRFTKKIVIE
jgi:acid phosphatase type 7